MSVRIKFVLALTLLVSGILLSSFLIIYNLFRHNQERDFDNRLWANAYNQYLTYYNIQDTDKVTHDKLTANLPGIPVNFDWVLLDGAYHVVTKIPADFKYNVDTSFLEKVRTEKEIYFTKDNTTAAVAGLRFEINYLAVVKLEYQYTHSELNGFDNRITTQFAIGF